MSSEATASWREQLASKGVLVVLRRPNAAKPAAAGLETDAVGPHGFEVFLTIEDSGKVTGYNGHVDLGTGVRTALAQIVADELDVSFDSVAMVLGDTARVPDQGWTIASETIQVSARPLRSAAAQARLHLLQLASQQLDLPASELVTEDGIVRHPTHNVYKSYGELLRDRNIQLMLDETVSVKPHGSHRIVGRSTPRVDIPSKVNGTFTYVHDIRVPGMLHGRVVRPPYAGLDHGAHVGRSLIEVDRSSIEHICGIAAVVVEGDFIGVVAEREEDAARAAEQLVTRWRSWDAPPPLDNPEAALRGNPSTPRTLVDRGDVEGALAKAASRLTRTYVWPFQMHGSIGPSCSVADVRPTGVTLWSGTQNPLQLRADIAFLLKVPEDSVEIVRCEAAGCYGRNGADDVGADAVLLSRAVGRPVRVQLTREQEHAWEPKGAAQVMDVEGGLTQEGQPAAYHFQTRYPSNGSPTLALLLTGAVPAMPDTWLMGDRTAVPPYRYDNALVVVHDMAPVTRAAWLRGVSAMPNSFAHESFVDELATQAGVDPIEYRLRYLEDGRAADLIRSVAARAEWIPHSHPQSLPSEGDWLKGRGFAYAVYMHGKYPGSAAAWSAWIADVAVNKSTGDVTVDRIVVGQDCGQVINPAGVQHQIHGNVIQSTSRTLFEEVSFEEGLVTSRDWGTYPILTFEQLPAVDVVVADRPTDPPLGSGESASVPSAAAIANAIFDATGVRFREPPFTPERVRAALNPLPAAVAPVLDEAKSGKWRRALRFGALGSIAATLAGGFALLIPTQSPIAPIPRPSPSVFSAATIERGRLAVVAGDCVVCHQGPDGRSLAGGHPIHTPFGTVFASNITPDETTGIGGWSYPAFERAMREGISRDGHQLYPAHPYPSFAKVTDADIQAIYAYLMSGPAIANSAPTSRLTPPFNNRSLMRIWNSMFLDKAVFQPDLERSELWNRGAYLVEGLGHCSACHSPRNAMGAERKGKAHLRGGEVDGWEAPALAGITSGPVPWTEAALFAYLSTGHDPDHGVAAGPMAPVVRELATLPETDRRAIAHYLSSLQPQTSSQQAASASNSARGKAAATPTAGVGASLFKGACAVCHEETGPTLFGVRPSLAVNPNVHASRPDNLIRVVLSGIMEPATPDLGTMPGFASSFSDRQVAELLAYVRNRFAPDAPDWPALEQAVANIRNSIGKTSIVVPSELAPPPPPALGGPSRPILHH